MASGEVSVAQPGEITVPGRKLLGYRQGTARQGSSATVTMDGEKLKISAGRSRFTLSTLAAT